MTIYWSVNPNCFSDFIYFRTMAAIKTLTLKEKITVIKDSIGLSQVALAQKYNVSRGTIQNILKRKHEYLESYENNEAADKKRIRSCKFDEVDKAVFRWFQKVRASNVPISGPIIQEKATSIANEMDLDFKASNGWLDRWKKRHNVTFGAMCGEGGAADESQVNDWKTRLTDVIEAYAPQDRYNFDETGLVWRGLPDKTLRVKGDQCKSGKKSKERLTVALLVNQIGEFEKPIVIGKCAKPRSFRNSKPDSPRFPVRWHHSKNAWMTSEIFETEMRRFNEKMKREDRNVLLFIDNATCHPRLTFSNVKFVFLPANTTTDLQPLDQGVIQAAKIHYRKKLMKKVLELLDAGQDVSQLLKNVTVIDAVYWIAASIKEITADTVIKCFARCGFNDESTIHGSNDHDDDDDDSVCLATLIRRWKTAMKFHRR